MSLEHLRTPLLEDVLQPSFGNRRGVAKSLHERREYVYLYTSKGYSIRKIATTKGVSRKTVSRYLKRMKQVVSSVFVSFAGYMARRYRDRPIHPLIQRAYDSPIELRWSAQLCSLRRLLSPGFIRVIIDRALADYRRTKPNKTIVLSDVDEAHKNISNQLITQATYTKRQRQRKCADVEHKRYILGALKRDPFLYLDELCALVLDKFGITISIYTMWCRLKEWRFTRKKSTILSISALSERNQIKRHDFVEKMYRGANKHAIGTHRESIDQQNWHTTQYYNITEDEISKRRRIELPANRISIPISPNHIYFVDETGVNARTSIRTRGRSKRGTPCHTKQRYRKGSKHISAVIACSRNAGVLAHQCKQGSYKRPDFTNFLRYSLVPAIVQERRRLRDTYLTQPYDPSSATQWERDYHQQALKQQRDVKDVALLIMDNASIHKGLPVLQAVRDALQDLHCDDVLVKIVYQPPYAPTMHPKEMVNAQMKAHLRRETNQYLPSRQVDRQLIQNIEQALRFVTPDNVRGYYNHCGWR